MPLNDPRAQWGLGPSTNQLKLRLPTPEEVAKKKREDEIAKVQGKYIPPYLRAPTNPPAKKAVSKTAPKAKKGIVQEVIDSAWLPSDTESAKRIGYSLFSQFVDVEAAKTDQPVLNTIKAFGQEALDSVTMRSFWDPDVLFDQERGYDPLIITQTASLPDIANHFMNPETAVEGFAMKQAREADEPLRARYGVPLPRNAQEAAEEVFGSILAPIPVPKVAPVAKGASYLDRGINAVKHVGLGATELFLPGRQMGLVPSAAITTPVGVGISEALDAGLNLPDYKGIPEQLGYAPKPQPTGVEPQESVGATTPESGLPPEGYITVDAEGNEIFNEVSDEPSGRIEIDAEGNEVFIEDEGELPPQPGMTLQDKALLGVGGVGIAAIGLFGGRNALRAALKERTELPDGNLVGRQATKADSGPLETLYSGVVQSDQVGRNAFKKAAKDLKQPTIIDPILAKMDLLSAASTNTKVRHALTTGEMPDSTVSIGNIAATLEAMKRELNDTEITLLSRGLLANSAIDTAKRATAKAGVATQPQFTEVDLELLQAYAKLAQTDPKMAKYAPAITQAYRTLLDYELEQGLISPAIHAKRIKENPNYVYMNKASVTIDDFSGFGAEARRGSPRDADSLRARAMEDNAGVQKNAVADPIVELPKQIQSTIRRAQTNAVQREILEVLEKAPGSNIKRVLKSGDDTISVMIKGNESFFKVTDKALRAGLEFGPNVARGGVASFGRAVTSIFTRGVVGRTLNPLFSVITAGYESMDTLIRPRGIHSGVINEALSKYKMSIDLFDPTGGPVAIPRGFFGYLIDSWHQEQASEVARQLIAQKGSIFDKLGPVETAKLAARLQKAYDGSTKAFMQREGISSAHLFVNEDALRPLEGMESIMPEFMQFANKQAAAEAITGGVGFKERWLDTPIHNFNSSIASQKWARAYNLVWNAMRESSKYATTAANRSGADDAAQRAVLASKMRRLGGDVSQRGGSNAVQTTGEYIAFFNNAVQPLAELGKRVADNPMTAVNISTALMGALTWQYLAAYHDPKVAEKLRNSTDEQNAGVIRMPGGLTIPMTQTLRPAWGPLVAIMNDITGIAEGGELSADFATVFARWADLDEDDEKSIIDSAIAGVNSLNPIALGNSPLGSAFAALALNQDPGMSRYAAGSVLPFSGEGAEIKSQDRSLLGGEGKLEGQGMSARAEKAIVSITGPIIGNLLQASMDFARANGETDIHGRPVDADQAAKIALSRLIDSSARSNGPIESLLYQDYEKLISANDVNTKLYYEKRNGIEDAKIIYTQEFRSKDRTGVDWRVDEFSATDWIEPEYKDTVLVPIGIEARNMSRVLETTVSRLNGLRDQDRDIMNQRTTTIEERNRQRNELLEERRELTGKVLFHLRQSEERIGELIGDPGFTYQDLKKNLKKYKAMPFVPQPMQDPAMSVDVPQ